MRDGSSKISPYDILNGIIEKGGLIRERLEMVLSKRPNSSRRTMLSKTETRFVLAMNPKIFKAFQEGEFLPPRTGYRPGYYVYEILGLLEREPEVKPVNLGKFLDENIQLNIFNDEY